MLNYNGKEIIYTFKYGRQSIKKIKGFIIFFIVCSVFLIVLGLILFTFMYLDKDEDAWSGLISIAIGIPILVASLTVLLVNRKHEKVISKWLSDENLFENKAVPWEFSSEGAMLLTVYRFGIDFKKKGHSYRKISLKYDKFFKTIEGKEIEILYSPKYDEVMVLELTE